LGEIIAFFVAEKPQRDGDMRGERPPQQKIQLPPNFPFYGSCSVDGLEFHRA
jgi:hypothetical protein